MKKSLLVGVLGLAAITLTACGGSGEQEDKYDAIQEAGVIKVATSPDYAPFGFHTTIDGKDKIVGADIDLVNAIADEMGVEVELMDMSFNNVLATTKEGQADIAVSAISVTDEREESFDFTTDYYTSPQVIVINKNNAETLNSIESLADKNVGAQKGTIQENIVKNQLEGAQLVSIEKLPNIFIEVSSGSLDALVVEQMVATSYVEQNPELMIADIPLESMKEDSFSIAVPKGNPKLVEELDKLINEMKENDEIDEMVNKNSELMKSASE
ncbi:transporter substrate-binding domain-containing protein [Enterococcus sp. 669A]|uniref:Transporter substrate-binding domain-containing protein n=1 Tax=Candidatus Enterococcus moelleringii TaxID=2815325 RepID=A0ABS3LA51_9ENTE|nr:transporter substrate-binding domain-containing protein [Enterococcus sp. 669A]MBO1306509.1 transporter substrate-binding domain-containing protein [Enterococcus sp. 669A]